jgi:hypothetical protein
MQARSLDATMSCSKLLSLLVVSSLILEGCVSESLTFRTASIEAGYRIRLEEKGRTYADVRREVTSVVEIDIPLRREKARLLAERLARRYRLVWIAGSLLAILGNALAVSGGRGSGGPSVALSVSGLATAVGGVVALHTKTADLEECRTFLRSGGEELSAWSDATIPATDELAPEPVWRELIERLHRLRSHRSCLAVN